MTNHHTFPPVNCTKMDWEKFVHRLIQLGTPLLFLAACIQLFIVSNDYIRLWRMPIWRMRNETSFIRSASYYISKEGADFLKYLNQTIPPNSKVVPALHSGPFSEQSILQFFMLNQTIVPCSGKDVISCLSKPDRFIIATKYFPPDESDIQKHFLQYPSINPEYPYEGVYVPLQYTPGIYRAVYPDEFSILKTLLIDLGVILAWFTLGWLLTIGITKSSNRIVSFAIAFPLGMGIYTWTLFLVCLAGAPLTPICMALTYAGLLLGFLVYAIRHIHFPQGHSISQHIKAIFQKTRLPALPLWILLFVFIAALAYISVGRGYSTYDDMAIWSLKGYYMAFKQDIWAASSASGHGLSYPLNIPLAIATFFSVDLDLLPGSKLAFFTLFVSMLSCIFWYLRNHGLTDVSILPTLLVVIGTPIIFMYASYGFANIPFTCYLIMGLLTGLFSIRENDRRLLMVSAMLLSLSGWTRPEGIGYVIVLAGIIVLTGRKSKLKWPVIGMYFTMCLTLCGAWLLFGYRYMRTDEIGGALSSLWQVIQTGSFRWDSLLVTFAYAVKRFTTIADWGIIMPTSLFLALFAIPFIVKSKDKIALGLLASSLMCFAIPLGMFVTKFHNSTNYLGFLDVSFDRAQFPAIILFIVYLSQAMAAYKHSLPH